MVWNEVLVPLWYGVRHEVLVPLWYGMRHEVLSSTRFLTAVSDGMGKNKTTQ